MDHGRRIAALRELADLGCDQAILVTALPNIRYLTGFAGSAGTVLVLPDACLLLVDGRYHEAAQAVVPDTVDVVKLESGRQYPQMGELLRGVRAVLIDPSQITLEVHHALTEAMPTVELVERGGLPEKLRLTKDDGEIARIKRAADIAVAAFTEVLPDLGSGISEREFAWRLEAAMRRRGADGPAFPFIVASGPHSSQPHAHPTDRVIREGEPVVVDFGALVDGYHSDITRTVWVGDLDPRIRPIHRAATAAHRRGLEAARPGVAHAEVDAHCREAMAEHGYDTVLHPSGHNVGLSIHERPYLSAQAHEPIGVGYVLTIEPGVYVPGVGGCRTEDTVVIREDGPEILSAFPAPAPNS